MWNKHFIIILIVFIILLIVIKINLIMNYKETYYSDENWYGYRLGDIYKYWNHPNGKIEQPNSTYWDELCGLIRKSGYTPVVVEKALTDSHVRLYRLQVSKP